MFRTPLAMIAAILLTSVALAQPPATKDPGSAPKDPPNQNVSKDAAPKPKDRAEKPKPEPNTGITVHGPNKVVDVQNGTITIFPDPILSGGDEFQYVNPGWIDWPILIDQNDQGKIHLIDPTFTDPDEPKTRLNLDFDEMPLKDALKSLFAQAKVDYQIDKDVPGDTKITFRARNLTLGTALTALTESAGIGWGRQISLEQGTEPLPPAPGAGGKARSPEKGNPAKWKSTYRITKDPHKMKSWYTLPQNNTWNSIQNFNKWNFRFNDNNLYYRWNDATQGNKSDTKPEPKSKDKGKALELQIDPKSSLRSQYNLNDLQNHLSFNYNPRYDTAAKSLLYTVTSQENHSTFICPHCKQQVTVIRKHVTPKCPTCGRVFQSDWKFCPFDGAKRPADSGDWKFCPLCGKPVS